ncbi:hypothetical protein [Sphingomonas baiyangensis]|uniref:SnoaL-like domain-containing protein n=1 Tax=Sphingomonas baiyangensis TaxID=2572576 RepID=A0A4U1L3P6_9SPHN|nr:hypothetical protein [Sphingomonas baiyangensis]TKD50746.1 hypothetical protein FBR43_08175 [Sphingomonas baiyangensis]
MKKLIAACSIAAIFAAVPSGAQPQAPATDALSRMFLWWNQAFKTPGAFTAANFSKHFTPDATLTLEGRTVIRGVEQWETHFQKIQSGGGDVEIVVPFKEVFEKDGRIYNYHVIRSRRDGKVGCSLAAGHADLRDGKIAAITLVRSELDPAKGPLDPQCWTK